MYICESCRALQYNLVRGVCIHAQYFAPMSNCLRALVSAPKQVMYDAGNVLDLAYVTPRLIVAAGPTDEAFSGLFRTPLDRVVAHLDKYRTEDGPHWHIWNFRGEGSGYDPLAVGLENWTFHPFPDHQPPSVELLCLIVGEVFDFLAADVSNVALLHCKEGKGRSGTVCCAYLMFDAKQRGVSMSVDEAISLFTLQRMRRIFGPGVSIACQRKYLHYWRRHLDFLAEMQQDFLAFHCDRSPYVPKLSKISKITVVNPTLLMVLCRLAISRYNLVDSGLRVEEISSHRLRIPQITGKAIFYEIPMSVPLTLATCDIRISFERQVSLAYTWMSMYFETLRDCNRPITDSVVARRLQIPWEAFDGIKGTGLNPKLFERLEINWVYHRKADT